MYLNVREISEVHEKKVQLKDVAQLWCSDPAAAARLNALTIKTIREDKDWRYVESVLDIIRLISETAPGTQVNSVGKVDYIIDYHRPKRPSYAWEWLKTLFVCAVCFFGAAFAIIVLGAGLQAGGGVAFSNPALIGLCAFGGSMAVSVLILALSRLRQITPEAMVLSGVALSSLFSGATTLLQYFADEVQLTSLVFWTFGDLGRTGWDEVGIMAAVAAAAGLYFFFNRWNYNALESGEQTAVSLGVNVSRLRIVNVLLCSVVAAVVVSYVGIINFIGLVAPHMVRRFLGDNHCYLIPGSALMGAVLLLLGDLAARNVAAPVVLPIGAITSFLGAPLFLYLLFKGRNRP